MVQSGLSKFCMGRALLNITSNVAMEECFWVGRGGGRGRMAVQFR